MPSLVEQVHHELYENEKVEGKARLAEQDAKQVASQQLGMLDDTTRVLKRTEEHIVEQSKSNYEARQAYAREQFVSGKQVRAAIKHAETRLGYLQWKSTWWAREFERLQETTGLEMRFNLKPPPPAHGSHGERGSFRQQHAAQAALASARPAVARWPAEPSPR